MNTRLKYLRKEVLQITQAEFAKALCMTHQQYSLIERGKRTLHERHIKLISAKWNVSESWMKDGIEPIFYQSTEEVLLSNICKELSPKNLNLLLNLANSLLESQE